MRIRPKLHSHYYLRRRIRNLEDRIDELEDRLTPAAADQLSVSAHGPTVESEYGCPADDLKAPPGWRFKLKDGALVTDMSFGAQVWEFRCVREDDWYLQAGIELTDGRMQTLAFQTRGAMSAMLYTPPGPRLILERVPTGSDLPTVESKYGKPVHELCYKIPYGWRLKLANKVMGGVASEFRPIRAGDYYLTVGGGVGLASALDEAYDSHRLILERVPEPPRPRRWVLEETGKIRVPKAGEWSYMNGLPHCWRDDAHTSYQMLRQVEGPEPEPRD